MREIEYLTHQLDEAQIVQIDRAVSYFHKAQSVLRLIPNGICELKLVEDHVDVHQFFKVRTDEKISIVITGKPLTDNWFSHARAGLGLITLADWEIAFVDKRLISASAAPDAHILTSLILTSLSVLALINDREILHEASSGCLFDFCRHKPDRIIKMRSAFICPACIDTLANRGISSVEIDSAHAALECVRSLVLGRHPQKEIPPTPDDESFIQHCVASSKFSLPPRLIGACKQNNLTLLIGSGLSLQDDIEIKYRNDLNWTKFPSWTDVPQRLSECLNIYTGRKIDPRHCSTLDEFLIELDAFRAYLGEGLYYPRAIFDIFTPTVSRIGISHRLVYKLPIKCIVTTNYDTLIQYASPPGSPVFTWKEARSAREYIAAATGPKPIIKIHGCATRPDTVVLTSSEYNRLSQNSEYKAMIRSIFENQTILFIGFGFNDPWDLDLILREAELAGASAAEKFAILPYHRCEEVKSKFPQVQTIAVNSHSEVPSLIGALIGATFER